MSKMDEFSFLTTAFCYTDVTLFFCQIIFKFMLLETEKQKKESKDEIRKRIGEALKQRFSK